jgi:hypothetical protein
MSAGPLPSWNLPPSGRDVAASSNRNVQSAQVVQPSQLALLSHTNPPSVDGGGGASFACHTTTPRLRPRLCDGHNYTNATTGNMWLFPPALYTACGRSPVNKQKSFDGRSPRPVVAAREDATRSGGRDAAHADSDCHERR